MGEGVGVSRPASGTALNFRTTTETCSGFDFKDMCSGSQAGLYLRHIDLCITQL